MAAAMTIQPLAPRPSPRAIAAWTPPHHHSFMDVKQNRPALKQLQQSAQPKPRRERPCDGCRRRKSKCVLQADRRCVLCEFHKQNCTFVENAQPRKRKIEDSGKDENPSKKRSPTNTQTSSPTSSRGEPVLTIPRKTLPPPKKAAPLKIPHVVDETLSLQRHRHCRYLGQTTALDARLIGLGNFNAKNETDSQVGLLRQVTETEYFSTHADAEVPIPDDEAKALADIEQTVGTNGPKLIEIYFENVHPSFPIIQKQAFLDRHRHGDRQFNPPLLAAMYLLALQWWESESGLAGQVKPDTSRLEYIAITSLTMSMQRPKISAVQAGLLLLQRAKSSTWTLTVQLVALGQDIGLHLDCSEWTIPLWERKLRKRLAWALYMQDKWSAVMHGRPSHINASDWNVPPPLPEDFDESIPPLPPANDENNPQAMKGRSIFMQMISLTNIMAEVCDTFYSQTAKADFSRAGRNTTQLVLNRAKPVQIKLKDWFSRLPPECKMESSLSPNSSPPAEGPPKLSSTGHLHLAYFATEISIHRRIVQSLSPTPTPAQATPTDPYLLYICRAAAKTRLISALEFVNRLRPEHLQAFWYFASATNFALIGTFGALLRVTSPGEEEAEFYRMRLEEYRWTLGVSCQRAGWVRGAVEMVEAVEGMMGGLGVKARVNGYVGNGEEVTRFGDGEMEEEW
ncbi:hypothetical protein B0A48_14308 [Cryoendolithus antarcticus]|uniref:Zn(2)-C6 fungal-type domain-containing protein n=1 Tax=Cryoendolithus antarcticus TaxID=1507870 RepID=A0A1V8SKD4_9PEZI|nr:hypothetical protein B0A48_14308 [Cryoendolithus antarcticus]